jgi:hypothetical protein
MRHSPLLLSAVSQPFQTNLTMHAYRSHTCGALRSTDAGSNVRLSGWVHRKRDHGGLLFIDLRDHYGLTQLVLHPETPGFAVVERLRAESVIRVDGEVVARGRDGQRQPADRRDRGARQGGRGPVGSRRTAAAGLRRAGVSRGDPPQAPLPRPAPRDPAQEHRPAVEGDFTRSAAAWSIRASWSTRRRS